MPILEKVLSRPLLMALMKFFSAYSAVTLVRQQSAALQVVQRLEGQIRIDGAGAVTDQQGEVHHLARLAALDNERDLGAGLFSYQAIMHGGHRQQAGNRRIGCIDAAVGENQQRVAGIDRVRRASAEIVERVLQPGLAVRGAKERGQRGGQQVARTRRGAASPDRGWSGSDAAA